MVIPIGDVLASNYEDPNVPGSLGPVALSSQVGHHARITVSKAQLEALWNTRQVLIPAPGAGRYLIAYDYVLHRAGRMLIYGVPRRSTLVVTFGSATDGLLPRESGSDVFSVNRPSIVPPSLFWNPDYVQKRANVGYQTSLLLRPDYPLILGLFSEGTEQEWLDTLAPLDESVLVTVQGSSGTMARGWAVVNASGGLVSAHVGYRGNRLEAPITVDIEGGGTGGQITPTLGSRGTVTALTVDAEGSGYAPTINTLTFDFRYRIYP